MLIPTIFDSDDIVEDIETEETPVVETSRTYKIDFNTGEILSEFIDDDESIKQSVIKAIYTYRDVFLIYSTDYGSELDELYGEQYSEEYLQLEIPTLIEDALMVDERIKSVKSFEIEVSGDVAYVNFTVETIYGSEFDVDVEVNI